VLRRYSLRIFFPVTNVIQASFANPTQIFADDVIEEKGENARLSAFVGAIAVGDLVKSTLGPKGMDKILQSALVGSKCNGGVRSMLMER
jgi:T-complex protein 1 subunit beta